MFRNRGWFGRNIWKPKNVHSLEHLKYLYTVLSKNQNISESNRSLLVETLRSIAEILIWGDQNDSSVFDFFLEKNMLSFFLKILKQKCGSYVCVQLLQTLNILFENIRNETSLYYLLSNNHVNSIIVHKFDFSDEEVMAYYISFLKTLSLKLNCHTVHFFYNEHTNDFPLYTEAIKFFNHTESMVRIAVRTLTLNVYKVDDKSMLRFIRDRTAAPYFSNLVWFIGNHVLELNTCINNDINQLSEQNRLADLVAEHLDHLHYLNDILCLNIYDLNIVLIEHLFNKLFISLYIMSLLPAEKIKVVEKENQARICAPLSLFLLSQIFLIIKEEKLINVLANIIFRASPETILKTEDTINISDILLTSHENWNLNSNSTNVHLAENSYEDAEGEPVRNSIALRSINVTDEEKEMQLTQELTVRAGSFLEAILSNLKVRDNENDYSTLLALGLMHAILTNAVVKETLLDSFFFPKGTDMMRKYNSELVEHLIEITSTSCHSSCRIRLVTLELTITLLKKLVVVNDKSILLDEHFAAIIGAKEESTSLLRNFYKNEDIFLDMFEDEYYEMKKKPTSIERLMMDANLLLQPTNTPMTGVEFSRRLPCGEVERIRRAIRVFLLVRDLVQILSEEIETQLPFTDRSTCINVGTSLDLNDSDLITCTVLCKDGSKTRRFLAMDSKQLILVEPHARLLGWGVTKLAGFLEDVEVTSDKEESKCLHVVIHHTNTGCAYSAKFLFDDHIRCMAAKQKLVKGRCKARKKKMAQIAKLLDIPGSSVPSNSQRYDLLASRRQNVSSVLYGSCYSQSNSTSNAMSGMISSLKSHYSFNDSTKSTPGTSCESSPKMKRDTSASSQEEIQLQHLSRGNDNLDSTEDPRLEETSEISKETISRGRVVNTDNASNTATVRGHVKMV